MVRSGISLLNPGTEMQPRFNVAPLWKNRINVFKKLSVMKKFIMVFPDLFYSYVK